MGLESGTDPSDMVATNPAGGDGRSTADDHLRLIKAMIKHRLQRMPGAEDTSELTLSSGAIVPIAGVHTVDTESDDATDDLDTITATNFDTGSLLMLAVENAARVVTIKHGVDNIVTADGADIELNNVGTFVICLYDGANWNVVNWSQGSIITDTISESTTGAGVTVDGGILRDSKIELAAGTVSLPAFTFAADLDTGLYRQAANVAAIAVGGADAARFNSSGIDVRAGKGLRSDSGGVGEYDRTLRLEIGNWNMDSDASVSVNHGLTLAKIRTVFVLIREDGQAQSFPLDSYIDVEAGGLNLASGYWKVTGTQVVLTRVTGGHFDGTDFNSTTAPSNRGWITITYAL